ncbi:MAG: hypothetical protein C0392_12070 [Syntrophus sp. (in: bacteria)]|nr:hypothetical protein [Syntrophus sp. (in: bacteria)]
MWADPLWPQNEGIVVVPHIGSKRGMVEKWWRIWEPYTFLTNSQFSLIMMNTYMMYQNNEN